MECFVKVNKGPSEKENRAVQSTTEIIQQAHDQTRFERRLNHD